MTTTGPAPRASHPARPGVPAEQAGAAGSEPRRWVRPRYLHPGAWWLWALGLAVAATRTTNPVLLLLLIAAAGLVVMARRPSAPWATSFRLYLILGAVVVAIRVLFRIVFAGEGTTVLLSLPTLDLGGLVPGLRLLGPVSAEAVLGGAYDGLRLATMLVCVGAANSLADPRRLLAAVPSALYELGTVLVVSVTVFPQLAESLRRVRRARALRAGPRRGRRTLRGIVIPVLTDALDRSLLLAAAMDSRGYGRRGPVPVRTARVTSALLLVGVLALCVGVYAVLDGGIPAAVGTGAIVGGLLVGALGFGVAGRRVRRTRYRPDPWRVRETLVAACGLGVGGILIALAEYAPAPLYPAVAPPALPQLTPLLLAAVVLAALPALLAPPLPPAGAGR
ncbi:energy-coupling factor transporter transmembrane protein EcfT [Nakamurella flavida]|uniref:Energy-coupling factor transporter transmembrane protein EcfT n=1 Tax=Nakamurella flavida TaxID=363630 RepID=A0A938YQM8_9ACTN|nr:energy-coupling factor transporter transmembrane protein EcfT [Nakamurella flavida]